jgi:dihydroanticapsin dehydrogenase
MRKQKGGAIIHICSISAFIAQPGFVTYSTTKGAIASMTRCMALDLAKDNIRVNAVNPGTVWTDSNRDFIQKTLGYDRREAETDPNIGGKHVLKRTADPEEIANCVLFLASNRSSFITASNLMVDGGYTAL